MDALTKLEHEHNVKIILHQGRCGTIAWAESADHEVLTTAVGDTRHRAIQRLREALYRRARYKELEDAGYRDRNTGEIKPLAIHHKKRRSAGRSDSADNLAAVGPETHERQHRRR